MKADQIARKVQERIERHRKFGGFIGLLRAAAADDKTDDGMWDMTEPERQNVRFFLLNGGKPPPPFAPGQVWTYRTRPGEEASRLVVCRVESHPTLGEIVHIHVTGLKLKSPTAPGGFVIEIGHMPYSAEALRVCLTGLASTDAAKPDFEQGYQHWKAAFDNGKAGIWTAALSEAVAVMEDGMNGRE